MASAAETGARVLAGLAAGRARAHARARERAAELERHVLREFHLDVLRQKPARGRAGRIARKLAGMVSVRHTQRILDRLFNVSDSLMHDEARPSHEHFT